MAQEDFNKSAIVKAQATDYLASGAKAALGAIPIAGSLLAEVAGSIIPNQRLDRIADFAAKLEERIKNLEEDQIRNELNDEEFTDLLEESLLQASRAVSAERRNYLASLVASSLTAKDIEHSEAKHLMRILGELSDVEILWLRYYAVPTIGGDSEFREIHQEVFKPIAATLSSSQEELDDHALRQSYRTHLVRLGLTREFSQKGKNGLPEFDNATGQPKVNRWEISQFGRLLLKNIGMASR